MNHKRVVVTGMGIVSPVGNSVEEAWNNAKNGVSGIDRIQAFDPSHIDVQIAGEVKNFDAEALFGKKEVRRTDRSQHFAMYAAKQALDDSGLQITNGNSYDVGCIVGTGIGAIHSLIDAVKGFEERGQRGVSPLAIPQILTNSLAARVSMDFGLQGPTYDVTTACATGNNCIGDATDMIRLGRAKVMLTGASEAALLDMLISGFNNMKTLSKRNDEPQRASRPFDVDRDGFVSAEGAAMFVLEELEHARARGAKIYCEVSGYGNTSDAYHITAPRSDGEAAARAMNIAMQEAGITAEDIDYYNAHGTSTPLNDKSETHALKVALGEAAYSIPMSSTKSMTGHMLGAASAAESVFSIMALQDNFIPPTINLDTPDPECDLDYTPNVGKSHPIDVVMNYSAGFGGHNVVIVFKRYRENGA